MKKIVIIIALALVAGFTTVRADNTYTNVIGYQATNTASFWGGLGEAGQAFFNIFKTDTNAATSTTWVAIPFASYDVSQKQFGGGIALIYPVKDTPLFVGARLENINGTWTTPSIQIQLKKTVTVAGFSLTPYGVGGTAIVNGDVAAYVGVGVYVDLYDFTIKGNPAAIGICGDYETWGGLPSPCGNKRANLGAAVKFSF